MRHIIGNISEAPIVYLAPFSTYIYVSVFIRISKNVGDSVLHSQLLSTVALRNYLVLN